MIETTLSAICHSFFAICDYHLVWFVQMYNYIYILLILVIINSLNCSDIVVNIDIEYDRLLEWSTWSMPLVKHDLIYHIELLCPATVLMGFLLLNISFSNLDYCLTFVLSPVYLCPSVYWFWLHKCCLLTFPMLIGLKLSLYFVNILYFAVFWHSVSSHHCNQAHSTTCQALFICKFQIPSILSIFWLSMHEYA